jgi:hypothetical protein
MKTFTKRFGDHRVLIICLCFLSTIILVRPVSPVSLDTSGEFVPCEIKTVNLTKAVVQDPNPEHVVYGLEGQYYVVLPSRCPPGPSHSSGKGEWLKGAPGSR